MTAAGIELRERLREILVDLDEHQKVDINEVDDIVIALVAHLRSWRPESVSPLGTLPPPDRIVDPREVTP